MSFRFISLNLCVPLSPCVQYAAKEFGTCPLVQCAGQPVLPVGLRDDMGTDSVKIYCPKCQCVYHPPPVRSRGNHNGNAGTVGVDGAAFGTTFPHLFLMTFANLVPDRLPTDSAYIPRVFGFRVHVSARQRTSGPAYSTASLKQADSKRLNFLRKGGTELKESNNIEKVDGDDAMDSIKSEGTSKASQDTGLAAETTKKKGSKL